ncbi:hypothetical protein J6590_089270 [Homalodisca vitripennis]|nr:hypothetical protein J6590_089270 [Homalodisca vitripennis]
MLNAVKPKLHLVRALNSLGQPRTKEMPVILEFLERNVTEKKILFDREIWMLCNTPDECPKQRGSTDYRAFVCAYAELLSAGSTHKRSDKKNDKSVARSRGGQFLALERKKLQLSTATRACFILTRLIYQPATISIKAMWRRDIVEELLSPDHGPYDYKYVAIGVRLISGCCPDTAPPDCTAARPYHTGYRRLSSSPIPHLHTALLPNSTLTPLPTTPTPSLPTTPPRYNIMKENEVLKEEIKSLQERLKIILDHSIESDQRLLKYTTEMFPTNHIKPANNPDKILTHQGTQTIIETLSKSIAYKPLNQNKAISSKTNVTGLCTPGAGLLEVAPTSVPPAGHCYVLLTGTNYLATGSQHIIFKHMETILENCSKNSKVLISRLIPRHDLPSSSPIHDTVTLVNNFIQELCDRHEGTSMIDISDIRRHHFTPHGLHLTDSGKRRLSCQIVIGLMSIPLRPTQSRRPVAETRSSEDTTMPPASNPAIPVHLKTHESYADAVKDSGKQRISLVQLTNSTNTDNNPVF